MSKPFAMLRAILGAAAIALEATATDPRTGGGLADPIGSVDFTTSGPLLKYGAGDTAWELLRANFAWFCVRDYGAKGDGVTDDTAAVQATINACAAAGGGVVYFAPGTYVLSQITILSQNNVLVRGAGSAAIIKWVYNAGAVAGSLITIGNASSSRVEDLAFDGSGLTNPSAGRGNHLIRIDGATGAVTDTRIERCTFSGMVAASGDAIHVIGQAGKLVSRLWILRNKIAGSRYGVGMPQGLDSVWVSENGLSGGDTEIALVSNSSVNSNAVWIERNEILHTSATVKEALRIEGDAALYITRLQANGNTISGGFATTTNVRGGAITMNTQLSGAFASATSAWKIYGDVSDVTYVDNTVNRDGGASVGPCISLERSGGVSPTTIRVAGGRLINGTTGGQFILTVDVSGCSFGSFQCLSANAGASAAYAIDIQAVTTAVTNMLFGPGIVTNASAGSWKAPIRWLCNGANITDIATSMTAQATDYAVQYEIGGGGGTFNGQVVRQGAANTAVGDSNLVGGANPIEVIGMNAGTFGPSMFAAAGSPEGVVTARIGSIYLNKSGGQGTTLYWKEIGTGSTGWVAAGGFPIVFGTGDTTTNGGGTVVYLAPGWITTAITTEIQIAADRPGTARNLRVNVPTAGTGAATNTYTARKNGVNTALAVSISNTATGLVSDTADSFTVVNTDLLSLQCAKSVGVAGGQLNVTGTMELA